MRSGSPDRLAPRERCMQTRVGPLPADLKKHGSEQTSQRRREKAG